MKAAVTWSVLQAFLAQAVGGEVEAEHEAQQRDRGHDRGMRRDGEELAPRVDRRAPVRAFGRKTEAEEAECAEKDRRVADPQAEIDDKGAAGVGQDFPEHDVP